MQLLQEQQQGTEMEAALIEPSSTQRWRQLGGTDASPEDIVKKIEDLEVCAFSSVSVIIRLLFVTLYNALPKGKDFVLFFLCCFNFFYF